MNNNIYPARPRFTGDYSVDKDAAREYAINVKDYLCDAAVSYGELFDIQQEMHALGKRYGLLTEFYENAIC